jgi:tetratricopeptide (TPR) repeat protein
MTRNFLTCCALALALACLTGFRSQGPRAYLELAQMLVADGQNDAAFVYFTRAIDLAPEQPDLYLARGFFLLKEKRYDEALADLSTIIRLQPDQAEGYLSRGLVLSELGRRDQANSDFAAACRLGDQGGCSFLDDRHDQ